MHHTADSGIKWENLATLKTMKALSVSSPHWLCTVYKHKRRMAKPYSLGSKKTPVLVLHGSDKKRSFRLWFGNVHSTTNVYLLIEE